MEVGQGPNWGCSAREKKTKFYETTVVPALPFACVDQASLLSAVKYPNI
jgi:hypothetical protein